MRTPLAFCVFMLLAGVTCQTIFCAEPIVRQDAAITSGHTVPKSIPGASDQTRTDDPVRSFLTGFFAGQREPGPVVSELLAPPRRDGIVNVRAAFQLLDISAIDEENERFEFTGILTLKWVDQRQAFDPATAGISTKVYQGASQCSELSSAWFPQLVLAGASDHHASPAITLLIESDGNCTLIRKISAIAGVALNLRSTPFDTQRLEAVFEVFGFDANDVTLVAEQMAAGQAKSQISIPQWTLSDVAYSTRTLEAPHAGRRGVASAFVLTVDVKRQPWFMVRLVVIPLVVIVMLSWSVFWMDRSSLGDRMSVSFVGILTAVTYQIVLGDMMPKISYLTLLNGFVNISFIVMAATVVINLIVGAADKNGHSRRGDRIDRCSRVGFPLIYFGLLSAALLAALL